MIRLSYRRQHISITELPTTELPDFTVLTGINGSGKTHLLEGIRDGKIAVDDIKQQKVRLFNWNDLIPKTGENADPLELRNQKESAIKSTVNQIEKARKSISNFFPQAKFSGERKLADCEWLLEATTEEVREVATNTHTDEPGNRENRIIRFPKHRNSTIQNATDELERSHGELIEHLRTYAEEKGCNLFTLTETDIRRALPPYWKSADLLQYQFSDWFMAYHTAWEWNKIDRFYAEQEGEGRPWLSDEEFVAKFGRKPWEITNEILQNAGLRYQFNHPHGPFDAPFTLRLVDENLGVEAKTQDLSSGEKILLSIALLLHQSGTTTGLAALPKLLLLDEIDAPLHPSFTRVLIQTLNETLVQECGIKVIMTTHSPSTVAMAPEDSLYEITRDPRAIVKCSKSHAIRGLTSGFISVAPSSVVVITESTFDADIYSKILQAIQRFEGDQQIGLVPLTFIPASRVDHAGMGGGCDQVENWAPKLNDLLQYLGDFRGLIDKDDGSRTETDVIRVLNRYSIENYLLDPLTIVAVLIKEGLTSLFPNCPIEDSHVHKLPDMEEGELQAMVDALCREAEAKNPELDTSGGTEPVTYLCEKTVQLPKWVFDLRGHRSDAEEHCLMRVLQRAVNPLGPPTIFPSGEHFFDRVIEMQTRILPAVIPNDLVEILHFLQSPEIEETDEADAEAPPQPESESESAEE